MRTSFWEKTVREHEAHDAGTIEASETFARICQTAMNKFPRRPREQNAFISAVILGLRQVQLNEGK